MKLSKQSLLAFTVAAVVVGGHVVDASTEPESPTPIVLRIGTDDVPGRPAADQIEEFARHVDVLSSGALEIEPVWRALGDRNVKDWDQAVAQLVIDGDLEMGNIPARSWDTLGVTSLRALHAPFLVATDPLLDAVVADDVLAAELLAGLGDIGVTGLALVPEGLRHIFSFGDPLLTPDDFDGLTVRAPTSATTFALFEALGATADDFGGEPGDLFQRGVSDGTIGAAESSFVFAGGLPGATTAAGNVMPYPKVNVIVVNADVLSALDDELQDVLHAAATATRDWAIANNRDDADYAPEFCANGGTIVLASDADVAALHEAARVVYDDLETDETTAAAIARIRELAEGVEPAEPAEPIVPCAYEPGATELSPAAGTTVDESTAEAEFPSGVYRMEITAELLIAAGVDRSTAFAHAGSWTLTFENGVLTVHDVNASTGDANDDTGVYCVENGRVSLGLVGEPPECGDFWSAGWTVDGDQLQFTDVRSGHGSDLLIETLFGGVPWTKIA